MEESQVHDGTRILLYRHFVEALTRVAWLRADDPQDLYRVLEKIIVTKLQPIFELKKKKTKDSSKLDLSHNYSSLFEEFRKEVYVIFRKGLAKRQSGLYGVKDETILVKTLHGFLKNCGLIMNDEDKYMFLQLVEKYNDPDETLSGILNETANTSSDKGSKRREKESQGIKNKRISHLVENELIFEEFEEILKLFLVKKKEGNMKNEADVTKFFKKKVEELEKNCGKGEKKAERIWPESEKDRKLKKLFNEKEEKRKERERLKAVEEMRKKEKWERDLMEAEDKNVQEEKEMDEAGSEINGSQENGNESEGSCF